MSFIPVWFFFVLITSITFQTKGIFIKIQIIRQRNRKSKNSFYFGSESWAKQSHTALQDEDLLETDMLKKMLSSPLWSFAHHVFTWPFSVLICIHYVFGHFTISFNFSEAEIISGSSPLPACLLKWHGGRQHCLTTKYCQGTSGLVLRLSPSFGLYTAIEIFTEIPAPVVVFFSAERERKTHSYWHRH